MYVYIYKYIYIYIYKIFLAVLFDYYSIILQLLRLLLAEGNLEYSRTCRGFLRK